MSHAHPQLLLVAASPTLRFTLEEVLTYYGYDVTSMPSAPSAETLADEGCFELLVTVQIVSNTLNGETPLKPEHPIDDVYLASVTQ